MPRFSIDTRSLKPGDIYIPIKGKHFDGHDFIEEAKKKGASEILDVDLIDFASSWRRKFNIPIIAITGSSGKTTVKDMLKSVLKQKFHSIVATEQNLNNEIGVPLTLLNIQEDTELAIIEMGMRGLGQIKQLADIACPTHAAITSIGYAHIEFLKTKQNIAQAKAEVFYPGSTVFIQQAEEFSNFLEAEAKKQNCKTVFYSCQDLLDKNFKLVETIAMHLGVTQEAIRVGLSQTESSDHRMKKIELKHPATLLDDTYNANPDSMRYLIEYLHRHADGRKILILGDMFELGEYSQELHAKIPCDAIDWVLTLGDQMSVLKSGKNNRHFKTKTEIIDFAKNLIQAGDWIGVKGSRGMRMEEIVLALQS